MRVRIVSYEDVNAWILGKFARKLNEELIKLGVKSDISNVADPEADFNHHIIYTHCDESKLTFRDSLMITHVDEIKKVNLLKKQFDKVGLGICMSKATMNELVAIGLPREKLCYINPAHDSAMRPRRFVIGITSKVQPTGSKREDIVVKLAESLDGSLFEFVIMGAGWDMIVSQIQKKGLNVTYYSNFDYDKYVELIPGFDYYLYPGQDEGSMGFIDALAAGVKTIVTPQGFHLDAMHGISNGFNETEELLAVFKTISDERRRLIDSVSDWTWRDYAIKHLEIWKYMSDKKLQTSGYTDGLNSLLNKTPEPIDIEKYKKSLYTGSWRRFTYVNFNRIKKLCSPRWIFGKMKAVFNK